MVTPQKQILVNVSCLKGGGKKKEEEEKKKERHPEKERNNLSDIKEQSETWDHPFSTVVCRYILLYLPRSVITWD